MAQKYEIFYGDKVFTITEQTDAPFDGQIVFPIEADEYEGFEAFVHLLDEHADKHGVVFMSDKPTDMLHRFLSDFNEVKAAGGLVVDTSGNVLMILRDGRWDLPKGKVEQGEFLRKAAKREVMEECGVQELEIVSTIRPTFHIYDEDNGRVLKTTYWYQMRCNDPENIRPQESEGITEVKWVAPKELKSYIKNTYQNIKIILALFASDKKDYGDLA